MSLRYAVVTPARNEEVNLERLAAAMIAQTHLPVVWVVVDDGSTDATESVLRELASSHSWIRPLERPGAVREEPLADGRRRARDLDGFLLGAAPLRDKVDVIVKVDADEPCMGWDGLDEVSVQLRGLRTTTFVDLPFRHHRPEGGRELSSLHHGEALGATAWYMGYRPAYLTLRAFYRARQDPAAIAMLWGYFRDAARRVPQCPNPELVRALRARATRSGVAAGRAEHVSVEVRQRRTLTTLSFLVVPCASVIVANTRRLSFERPCSSLRAFAPAGAQRQLILPSRSAGLRHPAESLLR